LIYDLPDSNLDFETPVSCKAKDRTSKAEKSWPFSAVMILENAMWAESVAANAGSAREVEIRRLT
jgi:hypothetical protein